MSRLPIRERHWFKRLKSSFAYGLVFSIIGLSTDLYSAVSGHRGYYYVGERTWAEVIKDIPDTMLYTSAFFGVGFVWKMVFFKLETEKKCRSCGKVFVSGNKKKGCPECGGSLDDLDGFFERNPDFEQKI